MKKISIGISLILVLAYGLSLFFTPSKASEKSNGNIFTSGHIDDAGVRATVDSGKGQVLDQKYYDEKHDITIHFKRVLTDDKETKLLLTYHSEEKNLKDYYIDLWEGVSNVNLIIGSEKKSLESVGWGSRYYSSKENKVYEALSFESIKGYKGQNIRLEVQDMTMWKKDGIGTLHTTWPLKFKLKPSATFDRETDLINKKFTFHGETYNIKQVEYSALETRVVVTGTDIKIYTDKNGKQYKKKSKIEKLFLNPRKTSGEHGYRADKNKMGIFLRSDGKKFMPIYSKEEVHESENYVMVFAPVNNQQNLKLEVGGGLTIPFTE
ncbi:hypothetical protein [Halobacillus sp. H74]|uniref:hypothetical protein n=1 Tax=Halobacillus sp. H74 TaxID=3457436 RepID=UPI003FCE1551